MKHRLPALCLAACFFCCSCDVAVEQKPEESDPYGITEDNWEQVMEEINNREPIWHSYGERISTAENMIIPDENGECGSLYVTLLKTEYVKGLAELDIPPEEMEVAYQLIGGADRYDLERDCLTSPDQFLVLATMLIENENAISEDMRTNQRLKYSWIISCFGRIHAHQKTAACLRDPVCGVHRRAAACAVYHAEV